MEANVPKTTETPEMIKNKQVSFGAAETTTVYPEGEKPDKPDRKTDEIYKMIYGTPDKQILAQDN